MATATIGIMRNPSMSLRFVAWAVLAVIIVAIGWGVVQQAQLAAFTTDAPPGPSVDLPTMGVGALGRLEPGWKVYRIAPSTGADGTRVERLMIDEGGLVKRGEVLAVLDTAARRQAAVEEARAQVAVSQSRLDQVRAGAKPEELAAQEALIVKHRAAVEHGRANLARGEALRLKQTLSQEDYDARRLEFASNAALLEQAEKTLAALRSIRPEDVAVMTAELRKSEAGLARAQAEFDAARIVAPISGRILKIHAREGERIGEQGLLEIGDTDEMHAVAEVYERDAPAIQVGDPARVTVQSLAEELSGEVIHVGWLIGRQEVFNNDPIRDTDARVVEVRIRLDREASARVARLSYARVEVFIDAEAPR